MSDFCDYQRHRIARTYVAWIVGTGLPLLVILLFGRRPEAYGLGRPNALGWRWLLVSAVLSIPFGLALVLVEPSGLPDDRVPSTTVAPWISPAMEQPTTVASGWCSRIWWITSGCRRACVPPNTNTCWDRAA